MEHRQPSRKLRMVGQGNRDILVCQGDLDDRDDHVCPVVRPVQQCNNLRILHMIDEHVAMSLKGVRLGID